MRFWLLVLFVLPGRLLPVFGCSRPRYESFGKLTRRHAVKIASTASVEVCSLAAGVVIGYGNILSAARMNNAIVLFLDTIELANELIEKGIVVDDIFTSVLPLSTPSKKVTLSNVPPFIKDEVLNTNSVTVR